MKGAYHFALEAGNRGTSEQEAQRFINNVRPCLDGETVLVLDWEGDNIGDVSWVERWLDNVYAATGKRPLIYMSQSVVNSYDWSAVVGGNYGLWVV